MFAALAKAMEGKAKKAVAAAAGVAGDATGRECAPTVAGVAELMGSKKTLTVELVETADWCHCCDSGCTGEHGGSGFPCCCIRGGMKFSVLDESGKNLFVVAEDTPEGCRAGERCCCNPCQSAMFRFKQPNSEKVLLTIERQGLSAGKCVCCFSCADCCNDRMAIYEGDVPGLAGELQSPPKTVSMLNQPCGGGGLIPTLELKPGEGAGSELKVIGPLAFGGCLGLCCDSDFTVSKGTAPVGKISHLKPNNNCELCCGCCANHNKYTVHYMDMDSSADVDRVNMLISSILLDMVFLQQDHGPCSCELNHCEINVCMGNCCGCVLPCKLCVHHNLCENLCNDGCSGCCCCC